MLLTRAALISDSFLPFRLRPNCTAASYTMEKSLCLVAFAGKHIHSERSSYTPHTLIQFDVETFYFSSLSRFDLSPAGERGGRRTGRNTRKCKYELESKLFNPAANVAVRLIPHWTKYWSLLKSFSYTTFSFQFRKLFDSIKKNDLKKTDAYRSVLGEEAEKEQHVSSGRQ